MRVVNRWLAAVVSMSRMARRALASMPPRVASRFLPWWEAGLVKPAAKLSVSVPSELARSVRRRVGPRGLSGFVARATQHELEREQLGAYLEELERDLGAIREGALAQARRQWRGR
jgi:hypothetical protein